MRNRHFCIFPEDELLIAETSYVDQKTSSWGSFDAVDSWSLSQVWGISQLPFLTETSLVDTHADFSSLSWNQRRVIFTPFEN